MDEQKCENCAELEERVGELEAELEDLRNAITEIYDIAKKY